MSPARRRKLERKRSRRIRKPFKIPAILWFLLAGIVAFLFINFSTRFWNGKDKLTLVINTKSGDVMVSTFDPALGQVTNITIPGTTQVSVSRQLGTWRIKSVWTLGQSEQIEGKLLAETATKNFKFPTAAWADSPALGFSEGNLGLLLQAIFRPYQTNLKIGDKIKLALFSLGVKNTDRVDINLADTSYLAQARLIDGENGYLIQDSAPDSIMAVFSDPAIATGSFRVVIENASSDDSLPDNMGAVLEVLGAKVASVVQQSVAPVDCQVAGNNIQFVRKVAEIYSCSITKASDANFDMELRVGEKFAKRF